jgi:hypothetical protein
MGKRTSRGNTCGDVFTCGEAAGKTRVPLRRGLDLLLLDALNADGVEVGQLADVLAHLPRLDVLGPGFV